MVVRAAIYARISDDGEGREVGVRRQEADCRELASKHGYEVGGVFVDNDTGASTRSRKPRPQYAELIRRTRDGEFGAVIAYSNSRLTRRPRESEDLIELAERRGVKIRTVASGDWDLDTADGRAVARTIATWDTAEAERTAERVERAMLERAREGKPHGQPRYGYERVDGKDVVNPAEAALVRETARRLLEGESIRSICRDLNDRGFRSPRGLAWEGITLRQVMLREANAGRRRHRGQVIGRGEWEPLLDAGTHDRVVSLLTDPARSVARGTPLKYLLSGIALCGRCGGSMRVLTAGGRQARAYGCTKCYKLRRKVESVDEVVVRVLLTRLATADGPRLLGGNPAVLEEAQAEAAALTARLDLSADQFADGLITGAQLERITARLRPRIEAANARARVAAPTPELAEFVGPGVVSAWSAASIEKKRKVIAALMTVTILPSGPGVRFSPDQVKIHWKPA